MSHTFQHTESSASYHQYCHLQYTALYQALRLAGLRVRVLYIILLSLSHLSLTRSSISPFTLLPSSPLPLSSLCWAPLSFSPLTFSLTGPVHFFPNLCLCLVSICIFLSHLINASPSVFSLSLSHSNLLSFSLSLPYLSFTFSHASSLCLSLLLYSPHSSPIRQLSTERRWWGIVMGLLPSSKEAVLWTCKTKQVSPREKIWLCFTLQYIHFVHTVCVVLRTSWLALIPFISLTACPSHAQC